MESPKKDAKSPAYRCHLEEPFDTDDYFAPEEDAVSEDSIAATEAIDTHNGYYRPAAPNFDIVTIEDYEDTETQDRVDSIPERRKDDDARILRKLLRFECKTEEIAKTLEKQNKKYLKQFTEATTRLIRENKRLMEVVLALHNDLTALQGGRNDENEITPEMGDVQEQTDNSQ